MKDQMITPDALKKNDARPTQYKAVEKTLCVVTGHIKKDWGDGSTEYGSFCVMCHKTLLGDAHPELQS